jgi:hypothetical protein
MSWFRAPSAISKAIARSAEVKPKGSPGEAACADEFAAGCEDEGEAGREAGYAVGSDAGETRNPTRGWAVLAVLAMLDMAKKLSVLLSVLASLVVPTVRCDRESNMMSCTFRLVCWFVGLLVLTLLYAPLGSREAVETTVNHRPRRPLAGS